MFIHWNWKFEMPKSGGKLVKTWTTQLEFEYLRGSSMMKHKSISLLCLHHSIIVIFIGREFQHIFLCTKWDHAEKSIGKYYLPSQKRAKFMLFICSEEINFHRVACRSLSSSSRWWRHGEIKFAIFLLMFTWILLSLFLFKSFFPQPRWRNKIILSDFLEKVLAFFHL